MQKGKYSQHSIDAAKCIYFLKLKRFLSLACVWYNFSKHKIILVIFVAIFMSFILIRTDNLCNNVELTLLSNIFWVAQGLVFLPLSKKALVPIPAQVLPGTPVSRHRPKTCFVGSLVIIWVSLWLCGPETDWGPVQGVHIYSEYLKYWNVILFRPGVWRL